MNRHVTIEQGPLPPHDVGAEEAVLAALLLDDEAIHRVLGILQPVDFFRESDSWVYEAAITLAERGTPITVATVAHELATRGQLEAVGGEGFLLELGSKYYTAVGVEAHAAIVARAAHYRRMIGAAGEVARLAYRGGPDSTLVQAQAEQILERAGSQLASVAFETAEAIVARLQDPDYQARELIRTGLRPLDAVIGGFGIGDLVCIGAHTSHGKTALSAQIVLNMISRGEPVAFLPVEGNDDKLVERMAAMVAGITKRRATFAGPDRMLEYDAALSVIGSLPLYAVQHGATPRTISAICAWITSVHRSEGVRVFFIDHIDAVDLERQPGDSTAGAFQAGLRRLQNTAARERVTIVFLSQVNRGADDVMPSMKGLRDSGAKEELSQLVLMLWMDYDGESQAVARQYAGGRPARFLHVNVEKHTEGEVSQVHGPTHPETGLRLPPFVLNLESMTVEVVRLDGAAEPAVVQSRLV